jgi:hypothetical protein
MAKEMARRASRGLELVDAQPGGAAGDDRAVASVEPEAFALSYIRDRRIRYLTSPRSVPVWNFNPTWSPHGTRVAYVRFKSVEPDPVVHGDIWTMRWDGTDRDRVSDSKLFDFRPTWGQAPSS